ncbi:putative ATP-dependent RNA helicase TDRD12 isoform X1 [Entelurus aequoreus]|uniref:putative ATP-dependent RNA helicase TDRD12 isoform X1 n=2 Tax=Entelurus aequoreus TaxID=161455 RepID=UPI002B1D708D|nr:putative ATP-dependent RNA helicase TDRD12 isoform X1 [Entelurus aequoreus]
MSKLLNLKVEDPSCLWAQLAGDGGVGAVSKEQYDELFDQMNLFYSDVTRDVGKVITSSLEVGQVCVVYWSQMKKWCRALLEAILTDSMACYARCYLVDHGELLVVLLRQIRLAEKDFLQLPYWMRRFHLARVKPTTLRVSFCEKAKLVTSSRWDSSATCYMYNLIQASSQTEAMLLEDESHSTAIELYVTIKDSKICVNDELVERSYAVYDYESADSRKLDQLDLQFVRFSGDILTSTTCEHVYKPPARTQLLPEKKILPPPGVDTDKTTSHADVETLPPPAAYADVETLPPPAAYADVETLPPPAAYADVETLTPPAAYADVEITRPLTACTDVSQSQDCDLKTSEGSSRSENGPQPDCTQSKSDSTEDSDASLAAAFNTNLSLFRLMKFLNPGCSFKEAEPTLSHQEDPIEDSTSSPNGCTGEEVESPPDQSDVMKTSSNNDWACSRLLEWLNPQPLKLHSEDEDEQIISSAPKRSDMLVHSALPLEPCTGLDDAPITDGLRTLLQRKRFCLSPADLFSWPAVAQGNNTVVISHAGDQPRSYLAPLLTHMLLSSSILTTSSSRTGPVAVVLCPGWEKVQLVCDLLEESKVSQSLRPFSVLLGTTKDEAKYMKIPKNSLLLVTTPFSFVRLLSCHRFLFLRMGHLVLDEADQLFILAPEQMESILQHFQTVNSRKEMALYPQQLVAVAKRWTSHMEAMVTNYMPYPCITIAASEEAALYGNVQQAVLMTLESNKISALLAALDFRPDVGQKTLIITNSVEAVEDVFNAVSSKSVFCLKSHGGLIHNLDFVVQQWSKNIGPGTHIILVTTSECLRCFGVTDATCVVHFGFPSSPKLFGCRLLCMSSNLRNLTEPDSSQASSRVTRSLLLVSEKNTRHVSALVRYLKRTNALLSPELLSFAESTETAREEQKTERPLCRYLKSFGVCRASTVCPDRHRILPQLDESDVPTPAVIQVLPLYVKTASVFYGRIIRKEDSTFDSMAADIASVYADKKPYPQEVLEGGLYAVQKNDVYHRVKVLATPDTNGQLFYCVRCLFIDIGKEEEVKSYDILQLPEKFHSLPSQAVEMILCQVKPSDAEADWHPKVTRAISQKIQGVQHRARAVLSLGNTIFFDLMVRETHVPGMKTVISEYNVPTLILNTGMGERNPDHLDLLKGLSQDKGTHCSQADHSSGNKAEERVLVVKNLDGAAPPDPPESFPQPSVCDIDDADKKTDIHTTDLSGTESGTDTRTHQASHLNHSRDGVPDCDDKRDNQQILSCPGDDNNYTTKSLHPQVLWYQTSDSVTVTLKMRNPQSQRCDFHADRVVYSGSVNERRYSVHLDLHANVVPERCRWELKSNEPVLRLTKQERHSWPTLLKSKNIFVSYDMEHMEEENDESPQGEFFLGETGDACCVDSDSSTDSD